MISMLILNAVDRGFDAQLSQTKNYKLLCVASPLNTLHGGVRVKIYWLGITIMCLRGTTCLPADFCFSELAP
jgi:hypothetical protein